MAYLLMLAALLLPVQRPARGRAPEFSVPQGWTVELFSGIDLVVKHSSGASLRVIHRRTDDLQGFAQRAAEGIAYPLGFALIGMPQHFNDGTEEWFQYEIRGNRIAQHRRILYRASRNPSDPAGVIELTYENAEDRFDVLLTEAQSIATQFLSK
jgi:hypothetical protein